MRELTFRALQCSVTQVTGLKTSPSTVSSTFKRCPRSVWRRARWTDGLLRTLYAASDLDFDLNETMKLTTHTTDYIYPTPTLFSALGLFSFSFGAALLYLRSPLVYFCIPICTPTHMYKPCLLGHSADVHIYNQPHLYIVSATLVLLTAAMLSPAGITVMHRISSNNPCRGAT